MYGIDETTKLPEFTRLESIRPGSEVTVLMTSAKESKGIKGHYAIFEGVISNVAKGDHTVGESVRVLMVRLDDSRRKVNGVNYAQIEIVDFLKTANGSAFDPENLAAEVKTFCDNIFGVAVKLLVRNEPGKDGKSYPKTTFLSVPGQNLAAQKKTLTDLNKSAEAPF